MFQLPAWNASFGRRICFSHEIRNTPARVTEAEHFLKRKLTQK